MELREKRRRKRGERQRQRQRKKYFEKCAVSVSVFFTFYVLKKWRRLRILRTVLFY